MLDSVIALASKLFGFSLQYFNFSKVMFTNWLKIAEAVFLTKADFVVCKKIEIFQMMLIRSSVKITTSGFKTSITVCKDLSCKDSSLTSDITDDKNSRTDITEMLSIM